VFEIEIWSKSKNSPPKEDPPLEEKIKMQNAKWQFKIKNY
jgi:hypothetical protein